MTDYLAKVQARADAAPHGPWRWDVSDDRRWVDITAPGYDRVVVTTHDDDLADFIAHARTDVPRLVAAIRAVEALCDRADAAQSPDEDGVAWGYWIDNATIRSTIRDALEAR
ncbi:MAG: hypothetical protein AB7H92_15680 [Microbacteriaceae bacterium]